VYFSILGPLAIVDAGPRKVPSATMPQRLLALLLLNANKVVPTGTIIDELWGTAGSKRTRQTVQTYVYQLRRTLESPADGSAGRLFETHPQGYLIRVEDDQLDLWRFDHLVSKGHTALQHDDPARAAELLRQALDLWTGEPLGGLETGTWLDSQVALLTDRRLTAVERRIEADLRLGEHRSLLGELINLTARHPSHEEFTAQLMLAAHRSGRRGEALSAYQRLRRHLVDELGLEPSEQVRLIHRELLADSPKPLPEPRSATRVRELGVMPAQLPFDISDFVGRERESAVAIHAVRTAGTRVTTVPLVSVIGQAGVGKTTFAVRAAHQLRDQFPDGQLFARLHDDGRPVDSAEMLRSFLHSLGHDGASLPESVCERAQLFRTTVADRRLLVLLDDASSVEQVLPLLPGGSRCAVLLTSRVRLRGLPVTTTVELGPMDDISGVGLLTAVLGEHRVAEDREQAQRIVELCDHSPLAIRVAAEKLLSRPVWPLRKFADRLAVEERRLAELSTGTLDVRGSLASACERLSPFERSCMESMCGLGETRFDIPTVARLLDVPELVVEPVMEALVDSHLLRIVGTTANGTAWFRFPALVRLHVLHRDILTPPIARTSPVGPRSPARSMSS
jgi:DNA-binding SARP family transcriptional activator